MGAGGGDGQSAFEARGERLDDLADQAFSQGVVERADIPITGAASYQGAIGLTDVDFDGNSADILGDLQITADFVNSDISGSAGNFITESSQRVTGSLDVDNGIIFRDPDPDDDFFDLAADISGQLTSRSGDVANVNRILVGEFYGPGATAVAGIVSVDNPDPDVEIIDNPGGVFAGRR